MAVARQGSLATTTVSTTSTSWTVTAPASIAEGDLLIMAVAPDDDDVVITATGWTKLANISDINSGNTAQTLTMLYKLATAGDVGASSFAVALSTSEVGSAIIGRYTGHDATTPIDANAASNSGGGTASSPVTDGITTITNDAYLIGVIMPNSTTITVDGTPSPLTEVVELNTEQAISWGEGTQAVAGATGTLTYTFSGSNPWIAGIVAIRPATGGGSTPVSGTDADTLAGSDGASLATATTIADSDTLAGSDAAAIEATLAVSDSDTLAGSDSASVSIEGGDATPSVSDTDTLVGSETLTLEVAAAAADADTLAGVDVGVIDATLSVADSDPLAGVDAASVEISGGDASPSVSDTDTLVGIDLASVAVTLTVADADTLVGIDASSLLTGDTLLRSRAINRRSGVLSVADQRTLVVDVATSEARLMSAHARALAIGVTDRRPLTIDLEG